MKKVTKAVVLCGGLATRFLPISKSVPKEMLPLLDKPILQIIVEDLAKAGIKDILVIVGRGKECILNHFDKNVEIEQRLIETNKLDELAQVQKTYNLANILFKRQLEPKGTGYCVEIAKSFVGDDPFVVMFGDEVMFCEKENAIEQLLQTFEKEQLSTIAVKQVPMEEVYKYGIIQKGDKIEDGYKVEKIVEKPKVSEAPSNISYIGPAVLTNEIFDKLKIMKVEEGKEKILTDAFDLLARENKLCARMIEGDRHDMGNKFGFVKANIYACLNDENYSKDMKNLICELADKLKNN